MTEDAYAMNAQAGLSEWTLDLTEDTFPPEVHAPTNISKSVIRVIIIAMYNGADDGDGAGQSLDDHTACRRKGDPHFLAAKRSEAYSFEVEHA